MSKEMEKLIEEIAKTIWATDPIYYDFLAEATKRLARQLITRIGKAYADGELELPGEVGRCKGFPARDGFVVEGWLDVMQHWAEYEFPALDLIALRKEEE